ncbi:MAG: hypothetical protein AAGB14_11025, partial [Verrucomicrobiota bacterium]
MGEFESFFGRPIGAGAVSEQVCSSQPAHSQQTGKLIHKIFTDCSPSITYEDFRLTYFGSHAFLVPFRKGSG